MENELIEQRKQKTVNFIKRYKNLWIYLALIIVIILSVNIRLQNTDLLVDEVTGKAIPLALDPYVYSRYTKLLDQGNLPEIDTLRYYPLGWDMDFENMGVPYFVTGLHKIFPSTPLEKLFNLYPVICFGIGLLFFFLFVNQLFHNKKIALLATAFLSVIPTYVYRTVQGFGDKEALGMMLVFVTFYLFILAWQKKNILFSLLAGVTTGLLGLSWGGINLMLLVPGFFMILLIILDKITKKDVLVYSFWIIPTMLILSFATGRYEGIFGLCQSFTFMVALFGFGCGIVYLFLKRYDGYFPIGIATCIITLIIGLIGVSVLFGPGFIIDKADNIVSDLLSPFGKTRFELTVSEGNQPFISNWISDMGWVFVLMFIFGSIWLFSELMKDFEKKYKIWGTIFYSLFIFSFIFSRYSSSSILNGTNTISKTLYLGSLVAFGLTIIIFYFKSYYSLYKDTLNNIRNIDSTKIFLFILFLIMVVAARGANRLIFVFSPFVCILAAYFVIMVYEEALKMDDKFYKISIIIVLLLILFVPFVKGSLTSNYATSKASVNGMGPSYNQQWQRAMYWVRENTPEDTKFVHWWDYGYWVQTGGERTTYSDGGNLYYAKNLMVGRHVLTGHNETVALEFAKTNNLTHLLIISDEIKKYGAYSTIGSDENYDRQSWIGTFILDEEATFTKEKDDNYLFFTGSWGSNAEPIEWNGKLYGGIIRFMVRVTNNGTVLDGKASLSGQQGQVDAPLKCIYSAEARRYDFEEGIDGCLRLIYGVTNKLTPFGGALWASPRVDKTNFARWYLYEEYSDAFELVYSDKYVNPLGIYNWRYLSGPLNIWKINYPDNITTNPDYLEMDLDKLGISHWRDI